MTKSLLTIKALFLIFSLTASVRVHSQWERVNRMKMSKHDSIMLIQSWKLLLQGIRNKDHKGIVDISLEKVYCKSNGQLLSGLPKGDLISTNLFIDSVVDKFYDSHLMSLLKDSVYRLSKTIYPDRKPSNLLLPKGKRLILYDVYFLDLAPHRNGDGVSDYNYYIFQFVKIDSQFKFFGLHLESPH